MSLLETPRIYFKGEISWDPIVTNNYKSKYDETTGETVFPSVPNRVQAFRDGAIAQVTSGNWNPHGTHRVNFFNTAVHGFDTGAGLENADPVVGAAAEFLGMLVDLEPYGGFTSQLFFDSMKFGVDGGYRVLLPRRTRFTARYINFARNSANIMIAGVASVGWQSTFAKADGLKIEAFDSKALQKLAEALNPDDVLGLTVRFNTYRTIYFDDASLRKGAPQTAAAALNLQKKLQSGGFQPNPARSLLVGTLGLWRKDEPVHEPGDRALIYGPNAAMGSAHARVQGRTLTVDFSNSVREVDDQLTKANLGTLQVGTTGATGGNFQQLGEIPYTQYDRAAYEASAGIVTVNLSADVPDGTNLAVRDGTGQPLIAELPLRAIPIDPNLYLDQGDPAQTAKFQVYARGALLKAKTAVQLYPVDASGAHPGTPIPMETDDQGVLHLPIQTNQNGVSCFVPSLNGEADEPTGGVDPQIQNYMYLRVRPADANLVTMPATWENVYAQVLANWNAMAPCMDNWLRLDDADQIRSFAAILRRLTDPANFESYRFMPVTRDMSAGERSLLYRFLSGADEDVTSEKPTPAMMSRAMRRA